MLRDDLNGANPNRTDPSLQAIGLGDLLSLLITAATPTESSVTVTSNVATLANQPSTLFQVNASAGGTTGVKKLLRGPITGTNAVVPATGQCVWDGGKKVLFNTADAVTAAHFTYARAGVATPSILQRDQGEADTSP